MNKLARLRQRLAALKGEGTKILEAADAAEADLTDDQEARFAEIETEIEEVKAEIASEEAKAERRRRLDAIGGSSPAGANTVNDPNPETTGGFASIGEFAASVHSAVMARQHGGEIDDRLMAALPAGTHQGGGDAGEGYLLPPDFRNQVWELVQTFDEYGPVIDEEPTSQRSVKLYADETTPWGSGGIQAYWRAEGSKMNETQLHQDPRDVPLHELYTMAVATEELLEDAVRLEARLTRKAAMAIGYKKNLAIVEGTGTGQPLGWRNGPALVTVAKESGQAAGTITAKNILKMYSRLETIPGDQPFWQANRESVEQLASMTIGDRPIWMPSTGLASAPGGTILGLPLRFSEFSEAVGQQGDIELISPMGYYGARRASGVQAATSIHLFFDYNARAFRWTFRYGGQPHLSAPIAPKAAGAGTRSHFITLAERA